MTPQQRKRSFQQVFQQATGCAPYSWQESLALSSELPALVNIPTGLGKTAGTILAWLWRRVLHHLHKRKSQDAPAGILKRRVR